MKRLRPTFQWPVENGPGQYAMYEQLFLVAEQMKAFGVRCNTEKALKHKREADERAELFTELFCELTGLKRAQLGAKGEGTTKATREWFKEAGAPDVVFDKRTKLPQFNAAAMTCWATDYAGKEFSQPAAALLGLRKAKTNARFAWAYYDVARHHDGRIHFDLNPLGTKGLRWSASARFSWREADGEVTEYSLNAQNVPSKKSKYDFGKHGVLSLMVPLRDCFEPDPGTVWCVTPSMRLLGADLRWKAAGEIQPGETLVGFPESLASGERGLVPSVVEKVLRIRKPCLRIHTTHGVLECSKDHMWVRTGQRKYARHRHPQTWVPAASLQVGDTLAHFVRPWDEPRDYDAGWLAGFFDGEGYVNSSTRHVGGVGFGQNPGPTLDRALMLLDQYGFKVALPSANGRKCVQYQINGEAFASLRFLGSIRPQRLLAKGALAWENRRPWGHQTRRVTITAIEDIGEQEVVAIQTSTRTFVCEGFLSHNCKFDYEGAEAALIAYNTGDALLLEWLANGADLHTENAKLCFLEDKIPADLRKLEKDHPLFNRREAMKNGMYGWSYQMPNGRGNDKYPESWKFFKQLFPNMSEEYFYVLIGRFMAGHTGIKGWQLEICRRAEEDGYQRLPQNGRTIYVPPTAKGKNMSGNFYMQSGLGFLINRATPIVAELCDWQRGGLALLLQVHDELDLQVPEARLDEVAEIVSAELSRPANFGGIEAGISAAPDIGPNWGDVKPYKKK